MSKRAKRLLDYDTYCSERKELVKFQQAAYDSYEKTLTALVGSSLALSVTFLAFLQSARPEGKELFAADSACWLYASWALLVGALFLLLACFFVNAQAFAIEIDTLAEALTDENALLKSNSWGTTSHVLYIVSAVSFAAAIVFLLYFCLVNITSLQLHQ